MDLAGRSATGGLVLPGGVVSRGGRRLPSGTLAGLLGSHPLAGGGRRRLGAGSLGAWILAAWTLAARSFAARVLSAGIPVAAVARAIGTRVHGRVDLSSASNPITAPLVAE